MVNINLRYLINRFLSYHFLDFTLRERLKLWKNLLLNEILKTKNRKKVPLVKLKIQKVYVISLKHRNDRREHIKALLNRYRIDFDFFEGVSSDRIMEFKNLFTKCSFRNITSGSKGCGTSHILLWKKISEDRNNSLNIIFEDDIIFNKQFNISNLEGGLPNDFDIFYLGSWNIRGRDINYSISENVVSSYNPRKGLYAYAITPMGAKKLLEYCLPINILYGGLDTKIGKVVRQGKIKAYQIIPNLVSVNFTFPSDIFNPSLPQKKLYQDTLK